MSHQALRVELLTCDPCCSGPAILGYFQVSEPSFVAPLASFCPREFDSSSVLEIFKSELESDLNEAQLEIPNWIQALQ